VSKEWLLVIVLKLGQRRWNLLEFFKDPIKIQGTLFVRKCDRDFQSKRLLGLRFAGFVRL
jgi:hypothetical protein